MNDLDEKIDALLAMTPYGYSTAEHAAGCLDLLREQVRRAAAHCPEYAQYIDCWPVGLDSAQSVAELPYLPVSVFKRRPPLALVPPDKFQRVLLSSATTGQEPSRIAVDAITAKRMTKGVVGILRDFIGSQRRPYLVIDGQGTNADTASLGARGAAIRALAPFATETVYGLRGAELEPDLDALQGFAAQHRDEPVIVYGFTSILWTKFIKPFFRQGRSFGLRNAVVLHSGGWKKLLAESVSKEEFNHSAAVVFGCPSEKIIDYYGMVENLGIIYPDCVAGNKHAPAYGAVVIRDPLTLRPVPVGGVGIIQVCSVLPASFPGHLLLTEDLATLVGDGCCSCGRPGPVFRFAGRIAKAEVRGCGNIERQRVA